MLLFVFGRDMGNNFDLCVITLILSYKGITH